MARPRKDEETAPVRKRPPASTPEARENQLINLATDLVEKKLRDGTATSQEIVHLLRLASTSSRLEQEKLKNENELLKARVETLKSNANIEDLYRQAIEAFSEYRPNDGLDEILD